jgi:tRNA A37 threonylcarbamoyladenosine dehydratase
MLWYDRTKMLVGDEVYERLSKSHVLVVGLGGVGGFAAESIARAGVGKMTIVDCDVVSEDNRNRQLISLNSTTGRRKTQVMKERLLDINPQLEVKEHDVFFKDEAITAILDEAPYDYIIDAIDTLTPKTQLIIESLKRGLNIVSSMGAGAKFDPTKITIDDISKTQKCPLAQRLRTRLRERGVTTGFQVVFSREDFDRSKFILTTGANHKKTIVGTISYLPPLFGGHCASVVIRHLIASNQK